LYLYISKTKTLNLNMEKNAILEHEILAEIKLRKSGRAYSDKLVEEEKIHRILEAARWAPSSMNEQPWRYIIATKENKEVYDKVLNALAEANQVWVKKAPLLVVSLAKKTHLRNGAINRFAMYDTGAANALLSLEATAAGLMTHQMGGYDYTKLKTSLTISDDFEIAAVISVGYPGNVEELPEALRVRESAPRERYTQQEIVSTKGF
jgi:nitroreductase